MSIFGQILQESYDSYIPDLVETANYDVLGEACIMDEFYEDMLSVTESMLEIDICDIKSMKIAMENEFDEFGNEIIDTDYTQVNNKRSTSDEPKDKDSQKTMGQDEEKKSGSSEKESKPLTAEKKGKIKSFFIKIKNTIKKLFSKIINFITNKINMIRSKLKDTRKIVEKNKDKILNAKTEIEGYQYAEMNTIHWTGMTAEEAVSLLFKNNYDAIIKGSVENLKEAVELGKDNDRRTELLNTVRGTCVDAKNSSIYADKFDEVFKERYRGTKKTTYIITGREIVGNTDPENGLTVKSVKALLETTKTDYNKLVDNVNKSAAEADKSDSEKAELISMFAKQYTACSADIKNIQIHALNLLVNLIYERDVFYKKAIKKILGSN